MLRIRFGVKDRDRMGLPEVVEFDPDEMPLREVRELWEQCGLTYTQLWKQVNDLTDDEVMLRGRGVLLWLACRRHGVADTWQQFDCNLAAVEILSDPEAPAPDGAQ